MSALWQQHGRDPLLGFRILRIGLNPERDQLYARVNQRAVEMFERGLIEETRALLAKYPHLANTTPFTSLGYKQARQHLLGQLTHEDAVHQTQQGHRNYAKRQMTWFRREPDVKWLAGFGDDPHLIERATDIVSNSLRLPSGSLHIPAQK
jgi:tRNA dimethylallyltransferase